MVAQRRRHLRNGPEERLRAGELDSPQVRLAARRTHVSAFRTGRVGAAPLTSVSTSRFVLPCGSVSHLLSSHSGENSISRMIGIFFVGSVMTIVLDKKKAV